ncbi:SDR family NAD(P)-dependent oxidoreductase [uncultured Jatrophihabitans sp.]|uniref:SDR family NAD(P)-dependent oxidoreductase n=1 Tax=uncultured Jatrophihabitans sp. TaxID=1610747 RepID=UPI0035CA69F5
MDLGLDGARVCVQGGTHGMGRAAALAFATEGARVVVLARDTERLEATVADLAEHGSPEAFGVSTDVRDRASVDRAFAEIGARWGQLNSLVCAVGPAVANVPWNELTDDQWLAAFDLGAMSAVRCARAALPLFRAAGWARIVNLAAMSARSHGFGLADYTAAKAALTSITKNLSLELATHGVLANVVSPGTFVTEQLRRHIDTVPSAAAAQVDPADLSSVMRWIQKQYHVRADLGRAGDPDEIAAVICFLGSRRNTYTTGANVNVDGGSSFYA